MTDASFTHTQEPVLIIEPGCTEKNYRADLWRCRELFLTLAAMLPRALFSNALSESPSSLIGKVYFPGRIIPAATIVTETFA